MKYKEFWIRTEKFWTPELMVLEYKPNTITDDTVHVIEYKAYSDVVKAHDEMVSINKSLQDVCKLAEKEIEKLQKQNEKLKDIATRVSKQGCNPLNQYDCLACDAKKLLTEIEKTQ